MPLAIYLYLILILKMLIYLYKKQKYLKPKSWVKGCLCFLSMASRQRGPLSIISTIIFLCNGNALIKAGLHISIAILIAIGWWLNVLLVLFIVNNLIFFIICSIILISKLWIRSQRDKLESYFITESFLSAKLSIFLYSSCSCFIVRLLPNNLSKLNKQSYQKCTLLHVSWLVPWSI